MTNYFMTEPAKSSHRRETLEAIHDHAVDAIITIDAGGRIENINRAAIGLFGYSESELIGQNVKMLMPSPYQTEHDGYLENYRNTGDRKIIGIGREVSAKRKDGTVFPVHLAVSEIQLEDRRIFAGFIRDLSDLKRSEQQQAKLGAIVEDSLNEVFIFSASTLNFIQVNRGARENLGYSLEELQLLTPVDLKPNFNESNFRQLIEPLLTGEQSRIEFTTRHLRKDGTTYEVEVHLQLSTYFTKPVFVAFILDITARLQAERALKIQQEQMKADLERLVETRTEELKKTQADLVRSEKYATLGQVSGSIAHEIRNPLNAVKTSAYFLLNAQNPSTEKVREHLERIDRQVTMIDNVITALADVAKLPEADRRALEIAPLLQQVVNSTTIPSGIEVELDIAESISPILADETQIVIAFRNLFRNARDAMPDGGAIAIKAVERVDAISISFADNGIGMSEDQLAKILEPLFTTKARGLGLGLPITNAVIEKNHGKLSIESKLNHGSTFTVSLEKSKT